jgi:hypothetical protein
MFCDFRCEPSFSLSAHVGSSGHREYWIPAGSLQELNASIVGEIEIVSEFHGVVR